MSDLPPDPDDDTTDWTDGTDDDQDHRGGTEYAGNHPDDDQPA